MLRNSKPYDRKGEGKQEANNTQNKRHKLYMERMGFGYYQDKCPNYLRR